MEDIRQVVIAESDIEHRAYLTGLVQQDGGLDVIGTCGSGRHALSMVEGLRPDILLLSLVLRDIDGLAVLEQLAEKALLRYPRIAVITNFSQSHGLRTRMLGADACFAKPLEEAHFIQWLHEAHQMPQIARAGLQARRALAGQMLDRMGMSRALVGFDYLVEAVALASCDHQMTRHMMARLYPGVAQLFLTTATSVERAIRRLIEENWIHGQMSVTYALFGYSVDPQRGKPTNGECIARLAEYVHFALAGGEDIVHLVERHRE